MGRCERCLQLIWDVQAIFELSKPFKSAANKMELVSRRMTSIYVLLNRLQCDTRRCRVGMKSLLQSLINIDRAERAKTSTQMKNCARLAIICPCLEAPRQKLLCTAKRLRNLLSFAKNFSSKSLKKLIPQQRGFASGQLSGFEEKVIKPITTCYLSLFCRR